MFDNKKGKEKKHIKRRENFIPSSFEWLTSEEQKDRAKELDKITKIRDK